MLIDLLCIHSGSGVWNDLSQGGYYVATLCSQIQDPNQVYDAINLGRRIDVIWPDERMRARGGRSHWHDWWPERGMEGQVSTKYSRLLKFVTFTIMFLGTCFL
jgi:hypothetical protein